VNTFFDFRLLLVYLCFIGTSRTLRHVDLKENTSSVQINMYHADFRALGFSELSGSTAMGNTNYKIGLGGQGIYNVWHRQMHMFIQAQ
jgi:hypothetical protein